MKKILLVAALCLVSSYAYTCTCSPNVINNSDCFTSYTDGINDFKKAFNENKCKPGYTYQILNSTNPIKTTIVASKIKQVTCGQDEFEGNFCLVDRAEGGAVRMAIEADPAKNYTSATALDEFLDYYLYKTVSKGKMDSLSVLVTYTRTVKQDLIGCEAVATDPTYGLKGLNVTFNKLNCLVY